MICKDNFSLTKCSNFWNLRDDYGMGYWKSMHCCSWMGRRRKIADVMLTKESTPVVTVAVIPLEFV